MLVHMQLCKVCEGNIIGQICETQRSRLSLNAMHARKVERVFLQSSSFCIQRTKDRGLSHNGQWIVYLTLEVVGLR